MFTITFDMDQTLAAAVVVLMLGSFLKKKIRLLEKFCIPAPVIGGLVFAILNCVLHVNGILEISFTNTLGRVCMVFFFTSVGFQANLKILRSGGRMLIVFLGLTTVMIVLQNCIAVCLAGVLGQSALLGMCTGSIPMIGGHGTAGAFGPVLEDLGLDGATTIATAAATYGLIAGSLLGGPVANHLIASKNLLKTVVKPESSAPVEEEDGDRQSFYDYASASSQLVLAVGIGSAISFLLSKTGMMFPSYIGAMIAAAIIRNIAEYKPVIGLRLQEINDIGGIMLYMFLGTAMITLKIWQLAELALPLILLLLAQTAFMYLYAAFVVFHVMGHDYDAAVITAGACGFGMGATPNAMANMQAVTGKYVPSPKGFLLVSIVGSLFADFLNSLIITFFINLF